MRNLSKILMLLFIVIITFAQTNDGTELLKKLQNKYNSIIDFTSSFKQVTQGKTSTGKFYYKTKDKFRLELNSRIIISDSKTVWNYTPANKKVIVTAANDGANSFSVEDYVFNYPAKCDVSSSKSDDGKDILILKPKTSELNFKEIKLIINNDYLIDEIIMTDYMDNIYNVYLQNTKINQNLGDKLFTFDIPQGTQIIDLR